MLDMASIASGRYIPVVYIEKNTRLQLAGKEYCKFTDAFVIGIFNWIELNRIIEYIHKVKKIYFAN